MLLIYMHLFAHQRRVHFMMRQARLRFEATRGPLQRAERRRAIRHGGGRRRRRGGRPELPRRRHRLAKVSEMLRNKLERDLTRKKGRQSERAGSLEGEETERRGPRAPEGSLFNLRPSPQSWDKDARVRATKSYARPDTLWADDRQGPIPHHASCCALSAK